MSPRDQCSLSQSRTALLISNILLGGDNTFPAFTQITKLQNTRFVLLNAYLWLNLWVEVILRRIESVCSIVLDQLVKHRTTDFELSRRFCLLLGKLALTAFALRIFLFLMSYIFIILMEKKYKYR